MNDKAYKNSSYVEHLQDMITALENDIFGSWFCFAYFQSGLHFSLTGGWDKVDGFDDYAPLREFADEMNAATKPIREKLVFQLKQDLANECAKLSAYHLEQKPRID